MKPINASDILSRFKAGRSALAFGLGFAVLLPIAAQAQYYGRAYEPVVGPYGGYGPGGHYVVPPDGSPPPYAPPPYGPYGGPPPYDPYAAGPPGPPSYGDYGDPRDAQYDAPPRRPRQQSSSGPSSGPRAPSAAPSSSSSSLGGPALLDTIQTRIKAAGYKLVAPPRQKGNIYLAEVEDSKSVRHRLVYDANDGHLIQNTPLGQAKKPDGPAPDAMDGAAPPPPPAEAQIAAPPPAARYDQQVLPQGVPGNVQ